jgi:hypothetical protein
MSTVGVMDVTSAKVAEQEMHQQSASKRFAKLSFWVAPTAT